MPRIAIIGHHEALRTGLAALLGASRMQVVGEAASLGDGQELLDHALPDVVLLDRDLPGGTMADAVRALIERHSKLGVVVYADDDAAPPLMAALDAGARGYALKLGTFDELIDALVRVAEGGIYVDPRMDHVLPAAGSSRGPQPLDAFERDVLELTALGLGAADSADRLAASADDVRGAIESAIGKLGARNRMHAIAVALERGDITIGDDEPG